MNSHDEEIIRKRIAKVIGKYAKMKANIFATELVGWTVDTKNNKVMSYYSLETKLKIEALDDAQEEEIKSILKSFGINLED